MRRNTDANPDAVGHTYSDTYSDAKCYSKRNAKCYTDRDANCDAYTQGDTEAAAHAAPSADALRGIG